MASEDAYLQHLVAGHQVATQVYNLLTPLQNGSTIMNSFLVSVPSLNMSVTVHPADSGLNLAQKISVETGEDLNQLVMVTHGYHIMRHIELGEIPGIKDYRDINIGSMVSGMYPYPLYPAESTIRYTLYMDVPVASDRLSVEIFSGLNEWAVEYFGTPASFSLRDKEGVVVTHPQSPNNHPPAPFPPQQPQHPTLAPSPPHQTNDHQPCMALPHRYTLFMDVPIASDRLSVEILSSLNEWAVGYFGTPARFSLRDKERLVVTHPQPLNDHPPDRRPPTPPGPMTYPPTC
ncbi:hypothetical protein ACFX2A_034795 [Malus domestica]